MKQKSKANRMNRQTYIKIKNCLDIVNFFQLRILLVCIPLICFGCGDVAPSDEDSRAQIQRSIKRYDSLRAVGIKDSLARVKQAKDTILAGDIEEN